MPPELVEMLGTAEVPPNARSEVEAGGAPVWVLERDTGSQQITVGGVVKLSSAPERIADDVFGRDALLDADALKGSGAFSEPAVLADVASPFPSDLKCWATARSTPEVRRAWRGGAQPRLGQARRKATWMMVQRRMEFVAAYQKQGLGALGRYVDKPDAKSVPEATGMLLDQMKAKLMVETVRTHLAGYPKSKLRGARDRLYWNVRDHGYRPVTSIVHTVAFDPEAGEPAELIAAETLYSSHYFYARLQPLALYTDTANPKQTYALYGDRLLFDGEVGSVKRKLLRSSVVDDLRSSSSNCASYRAVGARPLTISREFINRRAGRAPCQQSRRNRFP
jgi:hypothetical protein